MNDDDKPRLTYSEKEVNLILKKAIDLQARETASREGGGRLTREDLVKIAREAGIDPVFVDRALRNMEHGREEKIRRRGEAFFGAPSSFTLAEELPLVLAPPEMETLVPLIQQTFRLQGMSSLIGNTLSFYEKSLRNGRSLTLSLTRRKDGLRLEAAADFSDMKGGLFGGFMGGVGGGGGIATGMAIGLSVFHSFPLGALFSLMGFGLSYLLARFIYRGGFRSQKRKIGDRLRQLALTIAGRKATGEE